MSLLARYLLGSGVFALMATLVVLYLPLSQNTLEAQKHVQQLHQKQAHQTVWESAWIGYPYNR